MKVKTLLEVFEEEDKDQTMNILSLGAGVQSTTLLLLSAHGLLPKIDYAIFADTGWEPRAVYEHLDRIEKEIAIPAGIPIIRVQNGNIREDALNATKNFASMPLYIKKQDGNKAMGRRQCTREYKIEPVKRQIRTLLGAELKENGIAGRVSKGKTVNQWIGISTDEFQRAKDSQVNYIKNVFPLIELNMSRRDCIAYLTKYGFGSTPKSACIGCPFMRNSAWRIMKENNTEEWKDAVAFDKAIRNGSNEQTKKLGAQLFLHGSCLPLDEAPIEKETRIELKERQIDIYQAIAEMESEELIGCSPFGCSGDELQTGITFIDLKTFEELKE